MKLSVDEMATLAMGCQGWHEHEGTWRPERLPKVMQPLYQQPNSALTRMLCTSGVRLRFVSNTRKLCVELVYGVACRAVYKFDLLVDGQRVSRTGFGPDQQPNESSPRWEGVIYEQAANEPATMRTFDLWLPHMAQVDVAKLEVDDDCVIEPAPKLPLRWLVYGGSITQGIQSTLPTTHAYARVAIAKNVQLFNVALGGAWCDKQLAHTVPQGEFDVVSIAYGTNDFMTNRTPQEYHDNTRALVEKLLAQCPNIKVLVITPTTWVGRTEPNQNGHHLSDFRKALEPLSEISDQITVIHGTTVVPDDAKYFVDNVHPNDEGFVHYARVLEAWVDCVLGRA